MFLSNHVLTAILSVIMLISSYVSPLFLVRPTSTSSVAQILHVLDELGIEFSEETGMYIQQSVDDAKIRMADMGIDVSLFSSYPVILSILGTGNYDMDTRSFIPMTNSVYAFDAECFDIIEAYGDFLRAVSRISNEEVRIEDYHSDVSEAIFETGTGTQEVAFNLNGNPYCFMAQFYYDWMDCTIIDYVNHILDEQGIEKRIWCMFDGGQGFVVFYNTAEWAREFMARTGCALAVKAKEAL